MDRVAILIPCYNESKTVGKVIADFKQYVPEAVIYVYDNNSDDGTDEIARDAGAIVRYEHKQGKGHVIRRMFREIQAECYLMVDGDCTYSAKDAPEMIMQVLNNNADMVIGDRLSSTYFEENKRMFHNTGNRLVRSTINTLFETDISDIMTGYRALSYAFVKTFPVLSSGFEIETEMTIHAVDKGMQIATVVTEYKDRPAGSNSKLNTIRDGMKVIKTIFDLWRLYKPLKFFTCAALILMVIDMAVFVPVVLIPYINTGLVLTFPTLIVCGFVMLAAIVAIFVGIMLDTIIRNEKSEFEFRLQVINILNSKK